MEPDQIPFGPEELAKVVELIDKGIISSAIAKKVVTELFENPRNPEDIIKEKGWIQISDEGAIKEVVTKILDNNLQSIADFKAGKDRALGFLVGQAMKETKGKANPGMLNQMFKEELDYIRSYKSQINDYFKKVLSLQVNIGSKLGKPPEEFANASWIDFTPVLQLTQLILKMIQKQIENIKNFMDEVDKYLKTIDNFLNEKAKMIKRFQQQYDETNNDLVKKYIEVEKIKISFLNSIDKSEEVIARYYDNKNKLEEAKVKKLNDAELKILNDKNKEYESLKKSLINTTKKYENEYNKVINNSTKYEDKFINIINECINGIKGVSCDLNDKLKDIAINFFTSIRESFKIPLDLIDINLSHLKEVDEKDYLNKSMIKKFNNECKLVHILPTRYNLKSLELNNMKDRKDNSSKNSILSKNNNESFFSNRKSGFIKFEDGFEEMRYFEDDIILYTVRDMFNNFDLINHNGLDIDIEEEKNITKTYVSKIISNMSNKLNVDYDEKDKQKLLSLLDNHYNRVIFLHKLNDYRANCQFELTEKDYQILGELFLYTINISKKENDYHSIEMVIILSKTYYILRGKDKKDYLQNLIIDNECFKLKEFWEDLLLYSISKDVIRSNKRETINNEDEKKYKVKNDNIVFSQLLSLIDNMLDFGVEEKLVREIIEPKILFYKIEGKLKNTIYDYIKTKCKGKDNKKK